MKDDDSLLLGFFKLGLGVALVPLGALTRTWAMAKLWAWFILPTFAMDVPSWPMLYGLLLCWSFVAWRSPPAKPKDAPEPEFNTLIARAVVEVTVLPPMFVAIGYVAHKIAGGL